MTHPTPALPAGQGPGVLTLLKKGNLLFVSPDGLAAAPPDVFSVLHPYLTYDRRKFLYGWEAVDPVTGKRRQVEVSERRLYGADDRGRLYTNFGFLRRIHDVLKGAGYSLKYANLDHEAEANHPRPRRYEHDLSNVSYHFKFRERQLEALAAIAQNRHGVVHAVTGFGKMALIAMTCLLYPRARIHVVTKRLPLVNKLVEFLTQHIPNVGQFGDGRRFYGDRVTVFCNKSLGHSDFDCDFLLVDEGHEVIGDDSSKYLANYHGSRNFTFSASPTGRSDGTDIRLEAFFGQPIFVLAYPEAVRLGLVVPIQVRWTPVILDHNPAAGEADPVVRKRLGIWFNDERNDIIAADILETPADEQWLALTDTVYHAAELYKRVAPRRPAVLVYDKIDLKRYERYVNDNVLPADAPRMTADLKERYRRQFEAGEISVISTPTWEVGIDPTFLQHVFIASSFSSEIKAQQGPGRASRINEAAGKSCGIVHDYGDQFDDGFHAAGRARYRIYESMGWEQVTRRPGGQAPAGG